MALNRARCIRGDAVTVEGTTEKKSDPDVRLRVIVVDDDPLARRVVRDTLQDAGITVIAEAGDGREGAELALYYRPDVVVMDLVMPGTDGLHATRRILEEHPECRIVVLSSTDDDDLGILSLRAGAVGFMSKTIGLEALPRALHAAHDGEPIISRRLTMKLVDGFRRIREDGSGLRPVRSPLSSREWEVLDHMCKGRTTDEIADELVVSVETVRSHVKSVLRKLNVRSRQEAVEATRRLRAGMVAEEPTAPSAS